MKLEFIGMGAAGLMCMACATAAEMPPAATKLGCIACHAIDKKLVGPAWKDIAQRYSGKGAKKFKYDGKEYPLIDGLVMKVSKGGAGNWGSVRMPANDPKGLHKAEITELIRFEQSLTRK